ncbi:hypothetical protein F5Y09DRAFT_334795 [Xylaria sp. FL1042]|nr:hypothetical protein F5Y09DRAFT_334795 [Xylaria sp. FL1042]
MRKETVLSGTWEQGGWPELESVTGLMDGPIPGKDGNPPGTGPFVDDGDLLDFALGSELPKHFLTWRPQPKSLFIVSPSGHPNTLRIAFSRANLTGDSFFVAGDKVMHTFANKNKKAGVSVFLTQLHHIDLGIVLLPSNDGKVLPYFRFRAKTSGLLMFRDCHSKNI